MTRILIADDHDVVRSGLRTILEAQPNWEVVAEAADGKEAILKAIETKPDVAVIDYSLPLINGIEVTRQLRARLSNTEVLIFTMHDNETVVEELLRAGARGYLLKSDARSYLIGAIEALATHKPFFTAQVSEALLGSFRSPRVGIDTYQPRAQRGATDRRRTLKQANRAASRHKYQDRGDAPRERSCANSSFPRPQGSCATRSATSSLRRERSPTVGRTKGLRSPKHRETGTGSFAAQSL